MMGFDMQLNNQKNWHTLTTTKDDFGSSFD